MSAAVAAETEEKKAASMHEAGLSTGGSNDVSADRFPIASGIVPVQQLRNKCKKVRLWKTRGNPEGQARRTMAPGTLHVDLG